MNIMQKDLFRTFTVVYFILFFPSGYVFAQDRSVLPEVAVRQSVGLYESGGMSALRVNSQDCYTSILDKFFCFYLDLVAQEIDAKWVSTVGGPADPYFEYEKVFNRIKPVLVTSGMTMNEANAFLLKAQSDIKAVK